MVSASMSTVLIAAVFAVLLIRHLGSIMQVAVIVRDDLGSARARRQAALQAWDQHPRR